MTLKYNFIIYKNSSSYIFKICLLLCVLCFNEKFKNTNRMFALTDVLFYR